MILTIAALATTSLLASHLLDEVEKVCSAVIVLKNGVKYYEGPVNGLTQTYGYFEIAAENKEQLLSFLETHSALGEIIEENGVFQVVATKELSSIELSKDLQKAKIVMTHFTKKQPSLESQFLSITQTQKHAST